MKFTLLVALPHITMNDNREEKEINRKYIQIKYMMS
jgi:hypothetical protein